MLKTKKVFPLFVVFSLLAISQLWAQSASTVTPSLQGFSGLGHSVHGEAFDEGPRGKPWMMEDIGKTHFPITTSHPEVQMWFDQGNTLLHNFWYYEAERAFRWCVKLDPDCAMAYWGLARTTTFGKPSEAASNERSAAFIKEATKRKGKATERERFYIEAWEELWKEEPWEKLNSEDALKRKQERFKVALEKICLSYPQDIEAKSLFALESLWTSSRYGNELILQQVLAADPRHPGAHHYRIHNWDSPEATQALDSCALYGRIAPQVGHAQHMPGHIYSKVGMWQEAAISMDSALRVEARYMKQRMIMPFNDWNYAHNRNYLSYIQGQLGMAEAAIAGGRMLIAAPLDPQYDKAEEYGTRWQGMVALMRALLKFERWREILDPKTFTWHDIVRDKMYRSYCETRAHLGLADLDKATKTLTVHSGLRKEIEKPENNWLEKTHTIQSLELQALLALAKGETLTGLGILADAAKRELELRQHSDDPPSYADVLFTTLGQAYLKQKSPALAAASFEKTLTVVRNDAFALSGLVEAQVALDQKNRARDALSRLLSVWVDADPGLKWLETAKSFGLEAKPRDTAPAPQRNYKTVTLDQLGPNVWQPYDAPPLEALDAKGNRVTLEEYRGKTVLLIFYLGEECPHCLEQLVEVGKRRGDFARLDSEVLAISRNPPSQNAASLKIRDLPFRLLSDSKFENARRFKSYDDFEEMELHSTILIDRRGKIHWARNGGAPFKDFDFLLKEIRRLNEGLETETSRGEAAKPIASR
jgi:peroxiredoxin